MNQSGDEEKTDQDSSKNAVLSAKKKVPDNNSAVSLQSIQSNRPIVRKLSEARKMPFQQNLTTKDESKACSSLSTRSTTDMPSTKLPPPAPSTSSSASRFAFNFNAIKNRFAQNCPEPKSDTATPAIKFTKKRQFDGIKNDKIPPTETKSTLKGSKATDDNPNNLSPVQQNEPDLLQTDSKRQKSDFISPCTSSSSQQRDKFISVVSTAQSIGNLISLLIFWLPNEIDKKKNHK